jgi:hypothetical protein
MFSCCECDFGQLCRIGFSTGNGCPDTPNKGRQAQQSALGGHGPTISVYCRTWRRRTARRWKLPISCRPRPRGMRRRARPAPAAERNRRRTRAPPPRWAAPRAVWAAAPGRGRGALRRHRSRRLAACATRGRRQTEARRSRGRGLWPPQAASRLHKEGRRQLRWSWFRVRASRGASRPP